MMAEEEIKKKIDSLDFDLERSKFKENKSNSSIEKQYFLDDKLVCKCKVDYDKNGWCISSWYTEKEYMHKGFGRKTLASVLADLYELTGKPEQIQYIWNGSNDYVEEWLERNFDATNTYPIEVQKNCWEDTWDSHVYDLDVDKVLGYFSIKAA